MTNSASLPRFHPVRGRKKAPSGAIALLRPLGLDHYAARAARLLLDRLEESSPNA